MTDQQKLREICMQAAIQNCPAGSAYSVLIDYANQIMAWVIGS